MEKNQFVSFTYAEIMDLFDAFVHGTTIHCVHLAKIFTHYFQCQEEAYTFNDIESIYEREDGLMATYIFYRLSLDLMSPKEFNDFVSDNPEFDIKLFRELHAKGLPIDSAFYFSIKHCFSKDRFEFDVIPEVLNNLYCFLADALMRSLVLGLKKNELLPEIFELAKDLQDDFKFILKLYTGNLRNKKLLIREIKDEFLTSPEKAEIAKLFLIEGTELLYVKHNIIRFYLPYLNRFENFEEWRQQVEHVITVYMSILLPRIKNIPQETTIDDARKSGFIKRIVWCSNEIHFIREIYKDAHDDDLDTKSNRSKNLNICEEACEAFHNHNEYLRLKHPGLRFMITRCNQLKNVRLKCLREYFSLGSFSKPSAFAKSLKENLCQLTKNADLFFEDKGGFKQLSDIYHRGLLRFFWKYETIKKMKKDYVELSQFIKEEGSNKLFQKDGDTVRIKFNALDEEGWWVEKLLGFEYKPAHSADNYNNLIEALFEGRTSVKIGDREVSVHVVLFLIMFYYWIFISLEAENSDDIRFWSHCIFHKVLPVG